MIVLDTSVLIDALTGPCRATPDLRAAFAAGERIVLPSLVLYEWLRGPRHAEELEAQEELFPRSEGLAFGSEEAALAAELYSTVKRPRGREIDLAIAATTIRNVAQLWTANLADFRDIPGLDLYTPTH